MNKQAATVWAKVVGHASWWTFIVATLYAGGVYWWDSYRGIGTPGMGHGGWTAYIPISTDSGSGSSSPGTAWYPVFAGGWHNPGIYSLVAFVIVVLAAVTEAASERTLRTGIVTVAIPFIALGLLIVATPKPNGGIRMDTIFAMLITLAAVAIREVWTRFLLPRAESTRRA